MDFSTDPYDTEADPALWRLISRWAERAAAAGLGITIHAGEFSPANLAAALSVPGLGRIGHAVHAASDPRLLDHLARSGAAVECSLTSNVVLGAVPSYEAHPIRRFVDYGIPVTLYTTSRSTSAPPSGGSTPSPPPSASHRPNSCPAITRNAVRASFAPTEVREHPASRVG